VRGTFRVPAHVPSSSTPTIEPLSGEDDEDRFVDRECFEFNAQLRVVWNDRRCEHCRHYLTARCRHLDEFLDDVEDLTPE
jgi:hypothetical protein